MSDVFNNDSGRKEKILSLLKVPQGALPPSVNVEAVLHPTQPPESSQGKYTVLDVVNFVREKKIPIFRPRFISEIEPVKLTTALTTEEVIEMNEILHETQTERFKKLMKEDALMYSVVPADSVFLPVGANQRLMSYKPTYYNKPYDVKVLNTMTYLITSSNPEDKKYATMSSTFDSMLTSIQNYMLSTGTFMGQLNRFSAMRDIRYGLKGKIKPKSLKQIGIHLEEFAKQLEITLPITNDLDSFALTSVPSSWVYYDQTTNTLVEELPKLKFRSTGGPPFPSGYKKGAVITSSLVIMDNILLDVNDIIKGKLSLQNFINKYFYLFCGYMFPKEERYKKDDITNKTRNIISMNIMSHMLMAMIWDPVDEASKYNYLNYDTPSLKGFSPWKGGMDLFIRKILTATETTDFVYADNWYILFKELDDTFTFFSLDNEKAEANATPDIAQAIMYYVLSRSYIKKNAIQFSATWAYLAVNILPAAAVDNVAIFRNLQLRVPGLASGSRITFHVNHAITTKLRYIWTMSGKPRPGSPLFKTVCEKAGVNVKVELETKDLLNSIMALPDQTPTDGFLQNPNDNGSSSTDWPVIKLDLLGYDLAYSHELKQYINVLNPDRLMLSTVYPKKTADDIANPAAYKFFRLARYVTLCMMGAFVRPLQFDTLISLSGELRESLRKVLKNKVFDAQSQANYDDLLPTLLEQLNLSQLNVEFDCDRAMMYKLHTPAPQPTPPVQSTPEMYDLKDVYELGRKMATGGYELSKYNFDSLPLLTVMIPTLTDKITVFKQAKAVMDSYSSDKPNWADEMEVYTNYLEKKKFMEDATSSVLREAVKAIETLLVPEIDYNLQTFIPAVYEKDPDKVSNPIIGYHLPYQPQSGILKERSLQAGPALSRSQRKNKKSKARHRKAKEEIAALKEAAES